MKTSYEKLSLPKLIKETRSLVRRSWSADVSGDDAYQLASMSQEIMQRWASENSAVQAALEKTLPKPKPQKTLEQHLAEDAAFIKKCGYNP